MRDNRLDPPANISAGWARLAMVATLSLELEASYGHRSRLLHGRVSSPSVQQRVWVFDEITFSM
jgi:hypothetical protein